MHELLAHEPALDCAYANSGKLVVYRDAAALKSAGRQVEFQHTPAARADDYRQQVLDSAACLKIEPALAGLRGRDRRRRAHAERRHGGLLSLQRRPVGQNSCRRTGKPMPLRHLDTAD
jgi:hypothetical protein